MPGNATFHRPSTLEETLSLLAADPEESKLLAGGTAFTILWRSGLIQAEHVICCAGVTELDYIRAEDGATVLGALATFRSAEVSGVLTRQCPVLASTLHHVANLRVRNVATWGGNLAEADSTSDLPAVLVALDSEVVVRSATGQRVSTAADLLVDFFATTLEPDEMIVEVANSRDPAVAGRELRQVRLPLRRRPHLPGRGRVHRPRRLRAGAGNCGSRR